ncbi:unnamed protein product [Closterium sp. NIES-54]
MASPSGPGSPSQPSDLESGPPPIVLPANAALRSPNLPPRSATVGGRPPLPTASSDSGSEGPSAASPARGARSPAAAYTPRPSASYSPPTSGGTGYSTRPAPPPRAILLQRSRSGVLIGARSFGGTQLPWEPPKRKPPQHTAEGFGGGGERGNGEGEGGGRARQPGGRPWLIASPCRRSLPLSTACGSLPACRTDSPCLPHLLSRSLLSSPLPALHPPPSPHSPPPLIPSSPPLPPGPRLEESEEARAADRLREAMEGSTGGGQAGVGRGDGVHSSQVGAGAPHRLMGSSAACQTDPLPLLPSPPLPLPPFPSLLHPSRAFLSHSDRFPLPPSPLPLPPLSTLLHLPPPPSPRLEESEEARAADKLGLGEAMEYTAAKWVLVLLIGCMTGGAAFLINMVVENAMGVKLALTIALLNGGRCVCVCMCTSVIVHTCGAAVLINMVVGNAMGVNETRTHH